MGRKESNQTKTKQRNNQIKFTHHDETKKRAHDSQIVRAKGNLKLSYSGPSQQQASVTNQPKFISRWN